MKKCGEGRKEQHQTWTPSLQKIEEEAKRGVMTETTKVEVEVSQSLNIKI